MSGESDDHTNSTSERSSTLPGELWLAVLSKLTLPNDYEDHRERELGGRVGQADLAVAMRVSTEWYELASPLLYRNLTTSSLPSLLHGIDNPPIASTRSKRNLLGQVRRMTIASPAAASFATEQGVAEGHNTEQAASTEAQEQEGAADLAQNLREMGEVRALHSALTPPSLGSQDGRAIAGEQQSDELVRTIDRPADRADRSSVFSVLKHLTVHRTDGQRVLFLRDRITGMNAIQMLSPDHICLRTDGDPEGLDMDLEDPRRSRDNAQSLTVHFTHPHPLPHASRGILIPMLTTGANRWIIDCSSITLPSLSTISSDTNTATDTTAEDMAREQLAAYIRHVLTHTLLRAAEPWSRVHIDFALPRGGSEWGLVFKETMDTRLTSFYANLRSWTGFVRPGRRPMEEGEVRYRLTWKYREEVLCGGCGERAP